MIRFKMKHFIGKRLNSQIFWSRDHSIWNEIVFLGISACFNWIKLLRQLFLGHHKYFELSQQLWGKLKVLIESKCLRHIFGCHVHLNWIKQYSFWGGGGALQKRSTVKNLTFGYSIWNQTLNMAFLGIRYALKQSKMFKTAFFLWHNSWTWTFNLKQNTFFDITDVFDWTFEHNSDALKWFWDTLPGSIILQYCVLLLK